jgi:hypothetical protein
MVSFDWVSVNKMQPLALRNIKSIQSSNLYVTSAHFRFQVEHAPFYHVRLYHVLSR